jgi:hypothetical protein
MNETAERLERCARVIREVPVSERTEHLVSLLAMVISQTLHTSPNDTADFAALVAALMRD